MTVRAHVFTVALAFGASLAIAGTLAEPVARRVDGSRVLVTWSAPGPVDVFVGDKPGLNVEQMQLISDDDMDGRHEYRGDATRLHFVLRSERDGTVIRTAERVIALEGGSNFRDVGGYRTADGKHVRWGRIYRTGAMGQLTDRDYAVLGELGIRVFCDLRSVQERELAPTRYEAVDGARYVAVDYSADSIFGGLVANNAAVKAAPVARNSYREWPLTLAPQYKEIFAALLRDEAPLAFNCSAGQDRTGVATALVLTALGVPRETILEDYHLSTVHRRPAFERGLADYAALAATNVVAQYYLEMGQRGAEASQPKPLFDEDGRARLLATFDQIEQQWGTVENYLDEVLGVGAEEVRRLRSLYLE